MKNCYTVILFCIVMLNGFSLPTLADETRGVGVKLTSTSQSLEHRIALVIGNSSYRIGALRNATNDARAIAAALRELNFEVDEQINLNYQDMGRAVNRFGKRIRRDSVALFYYAGHGLQVQGSNYLVPVDMEIQDEGEVQFNTVNAGQVLAKMEEAKNPVNIVILDACRDNPFTRSWKRSSASRGLAPMDAPVGSFVAYSAAPGKTAHDGKGKNGLYTESLIRQIKNPGMKIEDVFKRVRTDVRSKSGGAQVPEERSSLEGDFYFARGSMVVEKPPSPPVVENKAGDISMDKANPQGLKVTPPLAGLASELAAFSGTWEGMWDGIISSRLVVERIDAKSAQVVYVWSDHPDGAFKAGWVRVIAKILPGGKLQWGSSVEFTFQIAEDRMGIKGERKQAGSISKITMKKEELPAPPPVVKNKAGDVDRDPTTGMEFVFIKGDCYRMGDVFGDGKADEKPVHEVCVDDFYMGKYEVTVGQFKKFITDTGHLTDAEKNAGDVTGCWAYYQEDKEKVWNWRDWANWKTPNKYQENKDDHPVSCVSWNDAKAFIAWIARKDGKTYRMPTEAEWEYAARGGTKTRNYWGDGRDDACMYANIADRTLLSGGRTWTGKHECTDGYAFVAPVGRFQPNPFGLYDMIGNVWEWTQDWYDKDYYNNSPRNNPHGPSKGARRVYRGSAWLNDNLRCSSAGRGSGDPGRRSSVKGFRLIRTVAVSDSPSIDQSASFLKREQAKPSRPAGEKVKLEYDDGTSERSASPWHTGAGSEIAVRFTPPWYPFTIEKVEFYVTDSCKPQTSFQVRLYDDNNGKFPGTRIDNDNITGAATSGNAWTQLNITQQNIIINKGDFFVSMYWITPPGKDGKNAQCLGADMNGYLSQRSFWKFGTGGHWMPSVDSGDKKLKNNMIRVVGH